MIGTVAALVKKVIGFGLGILLLAFALGYNRARINTGGEAQPALPTSYPEQARVARVPPSGQSLTTGGQDDAQLVETAAHVSDLAPRLEGLLLRSDPGAVESPEQLIRRWAEADPSAAADWAAKLPPGLTYHNALQQVVIAWAATDLTAATQWLASLPDDQAKSDATINLGYEAARVDPQLALQLAESIPASAQRDDLLVHAVSQWAGADSLSALGWARQINDPGLRQHLISAIATALAKVDGAAAATMVAQLLSPGKEQDRAAIAVVQRWAQASPKEAADWVALYPAGPARVAALRSLNEIQAAQETGVIAEQSGKR